MTYEQRLKKKFHGVDLTIEDFYLLESFQIAYLPNRLPEQEFSAVLHANPHIISFLINKHPPIAEYIERIQKKHGGAPNKKTLDKCTDQVLWEIADFFIYNKYPEIYDSKWMVSWDYSDITSVTNLRGKMVIDAGAGTGRVSFIVSKDAQTVFAIEPCANLRKYIRNKAANNSISNVFALDGFLHEIPLPNKCADVLITSNAIGWRLQEEIQEIERLVKTGGYAIHMMNSSTLEDDPLYQQVLTKKLSYSMSEYTRDGVIVRKYWKQIV